MPTGIYPRTARHRRISRENGRKFLLLSKKRKLEVAKKISESTKGRVVLPETRKKIAESNRIPIRERIKNWDKMTLNALHRLLDLRYGRPTKCKKCGREQTKINWALRKGHSYSPHRKDYIPLCNKCHYWYDIAEVWENYRKSKKNKWHTKKN